MEEKLKARIIIILSILTAIFLIIAVGSCNDARRQRASRDKEMANRLDVEEKLNKYTQEAGDIEKNLSKVTKELEEEKSAHEVTKKALLQEQLVNSSLKEELQKVVKLKEALEEDLKDALVASKAAAKTKK